GQLLYWDVPTGKLVSSGSQPAIPDPRFTQNDEPVRAEHGPAYWGDRHVMVWDQIAFGFAILDSETGERLLHVPPPGWSHVFGGGPDGRLWCLFRDGKTSQFRDNAKSVLVPFAFPNPAPATRRASYRLLATGLDVK